MTNHFTLPWKRTCWRIGGAFGWLGFLVVATATVATTTVATTTVAATPDPERSTQEFAPQTLAEVKAEALIQQALLARLDGNETECRDLLEQAREEAPRYSRTLWLLGHVRENDEWVEATEHQKVAASATLLDEYEAMRREVILKPERELQLARWCNQAGLHAQRDLHFGRLLVAGRLSKSEQKQAARLLNLELAGGQFWHKDELVRMKETSAEAMASPRKWVPLFSNLEKDLLSKKPRTQRRAERIAQEMQAAEILPAAEAVLPVASDRLGSILVDVLSRDRAYPVTLNYRSSVPPKCSVITINPRSKRTIS